MSLPLARILVFAAAAAVLVLEILAGRLMAPYIGVTIETFTGVIGVILAGIAAGSWLGGRLADASRPRALVGPMLIAAGILTLLIPMIVDTVGPTFRGASAIEIVALTTSAFFLPSLMLSTIPPLVVKLRLQSLRETGSVVGSLSAISTAGALAGTFVTGFVLIAAVPTRPLTLGLGVALVLAGLALLRGEYSPGRLIAGGLLTLAATTGLATADGPCEWQTTYFCAVIEVDADRPTGRILWLDTLRHSYVDLADPTYLEFRYARTMADVISLMPGGPLRGIYIGGGGFTLPRFVRAVRPGSTATVLEIDGPLVTLARSELGVTLSDDLRVEIGDARLALPGRPAGSMDLVVGDAFGGLSVPWHLTTREFVEKIKRLLTPEGVYVLNVVDYPPLEFVKAELATLGSIFDHVAVVAPVRYLRGDRGGNFVLVGSQSPIEWGQLQELVSEREETEIVWWGSEAAAFIEGAPILRDDFAPVDQMLGRP